MNSNGETDLEKMIAWKEGYTTTIIIFVVITLVQIGILAVAFQLQNIKDIKKNFPKYRCNPLFMPFVGNFGYSPIDNFNYCVQGVFNIKAAEVFAPIYAILGTFHQVLESVVNAAMSIRGMFSNFLGGVQNFMLSIRNKIQFLMNNVRMSFIRILNLMGKVYGSMFAVLFMGQSAMTTAFNLANNDLVQFVMEFCFAPDTPVKMADGSYKPISAVAIGDALAGVPGNPKPVVTSVFRFNGEKTPMVSIGDVHLSSQHYVSSAGGMVPAESHPLADFATSIPELVCLNVTGHRFAVGLTGLVVADYDEHSSVDVVSATQKVAAAALNSGVVADTEVVADYSLGVEGDVLVCMMDGTWKRMDAIAVGDYVKHSGKVLGVVKEKCDSTVTSSQGFVFSAAQLVYDNMSNTWVRSAKLWKETHGATVLYNIITEKTGAVYVRKGQFAEYIRDYREVPLPEMEAAYEKEFLMAH